MLRPPLSCGCLFAEPFWWCAAAALPFAADPLVAVISRSTPWPASLAALEVALALEAWAVRLMYERMKKRMNRALCQPKSVTSSFN